MSDAFWQAYVEVVPESKNLTKTLSRDFDGAGVAAGKTAGRGISSGILGTIGALAAPIAAAFAGIGIGKIIGDAIGNASDLIEAGTAVEAVFGDATGTINDFAKSSAKSLGQSTVQALDAAKNFGIFGKAAGLTGQDLASFSTEFVTLAADLASFNNTSPEEAIEALGAGLRGESEPLRKYGVLLDDATLKARATTLGIFDGTGALTQQQRVLAAQAEILAQTSTQQGDFAKTSGGLANQQRILAAQTENLSASLGSIFLPIATTAMAYINNSVVPGFESLVKVLGESGLSAKLKGFATSFGEGFTQKLSDGVDVLEALAASEEGFTFDNIADKVSEAFPGLSGIFDVLDTLAPLVPVLTSAFSELVPVLAPVIPELVPIVVELLPELVRIIQALLPIIPPLADLIANLAPIIASVAPFVADLASKLALTLETATLLSSFFNEDTSLETVGQKALSLSGYYGEMSQNLYNKGVLIGQSFRTVGSYFDDLKANGTNAINGIIGSAQAAGQAFGVFAGQVGSGISIAAASIATLPGRAAAALSGFGETFFSAGASIVSSFISGIASMIGRVAATANNVMSAVTAVLPHSPAEKGPFSGSGWTDVFTAGEAIGEHFTAGLQSTQPQIQSELGSMLDTGSFSTRFDASSTTVAAGSDRPIYMGGNLFGILREMANGEAQIVLAGYEDANSGAQARGYQREF